jgi:hypothetical protein
MILADLVALIGNWEVARWVSLVPHPYSEADGREWIAQVRQDHATGRPRRFAIALKETGRLIGGVGLAGSAGGEGEEPALGYRLGRPYWGNRYGRSVRDAALLPWYGGDRAGLQRTYQGRKLLRVVGGEDAVTALATAEATDELSYVSTAGGAFLERLEGRELPGVAALTAVAANSPRTR